MSQLDPLHQLPALQCRLGPLGRPQANLGQDASRSGCRRRRGRATGEVGETTRAAPCYGAWSPCPGLFRVHVGGEKAFRSSWCRRRRSQWTLDDRMPDLAVDGSSVRPTRRRRLCPELKRKRGNEVSPPK
uniref:Uncharacterized protein n=1 Tax=Arundo donax TaxID=35708 RepID=A0A0A8ZS78_ARUDO